MWQGGKAMMPKSLGFQAVSTMRLHRKKHKEASTEQANARRRKSVLSKEDKDSAQMIT
jgi:hypothetical protein